MKFRVLLKRYRAILFAAIVGGVFFFLGVNRIHIDRSSMMWIGSSLLLWAFLSTFAKIFKSEKVYSLWIQIPVLIVLLYVSFLLALAFNKVYG